LYACTPPGRRQHFRPRFSRLGRQTAASRIGSTCHTVSTSANLLSLAPWWHESGGLVQNRAAHHRSLFIHEGPLVTLLGSCLRLGAISLEAFTQPSRNLCFSSHSFSSICFSVSFSTYLQLASIILQLATRITRTPSTAIRHAVPMERRTRAADAAPCHPVRQLETFRRALVCCCRPIGWRTVSVRRQVRQTFLPSLSIRMIID
jgi:hypothetical protein